MVQRPAASTYNPAHGAAQHGVAPRLLFVLTGTGRACCEDRANRLGLVARRRYVAEMPRTVPASVLEDEGLGGEVCWPIADLDAGAGRWWGNGRYTALTGSGVVRCL